jgi:hypothetical protein
MHEKKVIAEEIAEIVQSAHAPRRNAMVLEGQRQLHPRCYLVCKATQRALLQLDDGRRPQAFLRGHGQYRPVTVTVDYCDAIQQHALDCGSPLNCMCKKQKC